LEINLLGHRKRILFSLKEELKEQETSEQPEVSDRKQGGHHWCENL